LAHSGTHWVSQLAVEIEKHDRTGLRGMSLDADLFYTLLDFLIEHAGHRQPRDVSLDVRHEDGNAKSGKALGEHHERDCLSGAGGAGDKPVPIAVFRQEIDRSLALANEDLIHCPTRR